MDFRHSRNIGCMVGTVFSIAGFDNEGRLFAAFKQVSVTLSGVVGGSAILRSFFMV